MGQCLCGDIGAGDGVVTGEHQTQVCTSVVPGHRVVHPVLEGRIDLGKDRACVQGRVQDRVYLQRVSMWEKRSACLDLGVLRVNGALGG